MSAFTSRCPLCFARGLQPSTRSLRFDGRRRYYPVECSHCGLLVAEGAHAAAALQEGDWMTSGGEAACRDDTDFGFDIFTLRILAAKHGYAAFPADHVQHDAMVKPHSELPGTAVIKPLAGFSAAPVSLGFMCRPGEVETVMQQAERLRSLASGCIIVVDAEDVSALPSIADGFFALKARPLSGDFSGQRNVIQDAGEADWMLQLDADEQLEPAVFGQLQRMASLADIQGIVSIGLPRQNYVDGVLTDLYPDVQYRLNRRALRFAGLVHERPQRPWQSSTIAVGMNIKHALVGEHVRSRSRRYEEIDPGNGRLDEETELTTPYCPG